jgi:tight adherence protein C
MEVTIIIALLFSAAIGISARMFLSPKEQASEQERMLREKRERQERAQRKAVGEQRMRGFVNALSAVTNRVVPANSQVSGIIRTMLLKAGFTAQSLPLWWTIEIFSVVAGISLGLTLGGADVGRTVALSVLLAIVLGVMPFAILKSMAQTRSKRIKDELPAALDLMASVCYAGCTLDEAMTKVGQYMEGPLPEEFRRVMGLVSIGVPRDRALREMAGRVDVPQLTSLVSSIIEAIKTGGAISKTLSEQATTMRVQRSLEIEEYAAKLPVKMLPIMLIFMFSTVPITVMAPYLKGLFSSLAGAFGGA